MPRRECGNEAQSCWGDKWGMPASRVAAGDSNGGSGGGGGSDDSRPPFRSQYGDKRASGMPYLNTSAPPQAAVLPVLLNPAECRLAALATSPACYQCRSWRERMSQTSCRANTLATEELPSV